MRKKFKLIYFALITVIISITVMVNCFVSVNAETSSVNPEKEIIGTLAVTGAFRDCPSIDCKLIRYYAETAEIRIINIDDSNKWYKVKANDDYGNEITGWMHHSLFTQDFRESILDINQNSPEESKSGIEITTEGKLDSMFSFLQNKTFQIGLMTIFIFIIFLAIIFLFRGKIKKFPKNINFPKRSKMKTFISKIFDIIFQYIKDHLRIKRAKFSIRRIIFIAIIGSILIAPAVFGLNEYQKFVIEKQELENELKITAQEKGRLQTELTGSQEKQKEAEELAQLKRQQLASQKIKTSQVLREKEEVEKEIQEKNIREQELNADKDGDGLTYREELSRGTSDTNTDSDGDGIRDGLDMHPAGDGRYRPQYFKWIYEGKQWEWTYSIHDDWYEFYKNMPRAEHPSNAFVTYYDPFIQEIADALKKTATKEGYHKTSFAIAFVQGLPYVQDFYTGYDDYPKYPIETVIDRNGDCEDTAYLAASITEAMGIGTVLIELPGHMAIGLWTDPAQTGTYYNLNGKTYYYFETTAENWSLGDIPNQHRSTRAALRDIDSNSVAYVYPSYKKPCYYSSEFPGYYYDENNYYYKDSHCTNRVICLYYSGYYYKGDNYYWDSSCTQKVVAGCSKSTEFSGYFWNGYNWYYDSQCSQIFYPYGP